MLLVSARIKEPLAIGDRKPLPKQEMLAAVNPVSISALQCFCEGKSLSDLNTYYLLNDAHFSDARRSLYIACLGVVMTASGMIGRQTIQKLGMRGHTTFQNLASAVGFTMMGSTTMTPVIFGSLPIYAFAMERRAAVSAMATRSAAAVGLGKGEFQAASANLRAIAVGIAPLLYAKVYAWSLARKGKPGLPYFAAAVIALFAELLHRMLSTRQLNL